MVMKNNWENSSNSGSKNNNSNNDIVDLELLWQLLLTDHLP